MRRIKKIFLSSTLILCMLSIIMFTGCTTTKGSYPNAVAWDNISYGVSKTEVSKDKLGKQLGEVKRKIEPMPKENGDANDTPVGSKLFEIKGIDAKETIAVERDGKFYEASKNGPLK